MDSKERRHSAESWSKLHVDTPSFHVSKGPSSTIFRSLTSLPNTAQKHITADTALLEVLHVFTAYRQIYMCVTINAYMDMQSVFGQVSVHTFLHACVSCVCVSMCVESLWTPSAPHEILKGEDGDVRVLRLAGDVSWSSAGLWAVVMVVWPTHSLLPCPPPAPPPLFSHRANDLHAWDDFSSWLREGSIL